MVSSRVLISLVMAFVMVASSEAHGGSNWWWWNKPTKIPTTVPTTCNNEPGLWFNGTTLSVFYSSCLSKCCAACQADPACYSYSYSKRRQECYKVGASTVRVYDSNWQSGLVKTTTTVTATLVPVTTPSPVATVATACFVATNFNYNNANFNSSVALSYAECCNRCGQTTGCVAWTWSSLTQVCYLKNTIPAANEQVPLTYSFSGVPSLVPPSSTAAPVTTTVSPVTTTVVPATTTVAPATTTASPVAGTTRSSGCFVEVDFNYIGNDISITTAASLGDCCNLCGSNAACAVWTYTTATRQCSLKSVVALSQRIATVGYVSGIITLR